MNSPKIRLFCQTINLDTGDCSNWFAQQGMMPVCIRRSIINLPHFGVVMHKKYKDVEGTFIANEIGEILNNH